MGYYFRKPIVDKIARIGSSNEQPVVITQRTTSTPSPSPTTTPTSTATATPKPAIATATPKSIAEISPTPKVAMTEKLPSSGPADLPLLIGGMATISGTWLTIRRNQSQLRAKMRNLDIQ